MLGAHFNSQWCRAEWHDSPAYIFTSICFLAGGVNISPEHFNLDALKAPQSQHIQDVRHIPLSSSLYPPHLVAFTHHSSSLLWTSLFRLLGITTSTSLSAWQPPNSSDTSLFSQRSDHSDVHSVLSQLPSHLGSHHFLHPFFISFLKQTVAVTAPFPEPYSLPGAVNKNKNKKLN